MRYKFIGIILVMLMCIIPIVSVIILTDNLIDYKPNSSSYNPTINFNWDNEQINSSDLNPNLVNLVHKKVETNNYYGTYDFNNETVGNYTSDPTSLGFVNSAIIGSNCFLSLDNELNGHKNILNITDNSDSQYIYI
ncbi:MAG: hypothetical protein P8Y70_01535 [Candidatus Lokiarchaeota archaeon]